MSEFGIEYLRKKLASKRPRVLTRYKYYEMKDMKLDRSVTIPTELRKQYMATMGWCAKSVDSIADRLIFNKFSEDNFGINEIYAMNNPDLIYNSAILGALISSCDFISIGKDDNGQPKLEVIDGSDGTGIIDINTGMLTEGYAVLERDDSGKAIREAHYTIPKTIYYENGKEIGSMENKAPYALLVPIIYRPDATRPFGRSRISRACMYYQQLAKRTLERSEISAEFYAYPQRYVLGLSPEAEQMDPMRALMTSMLQFDKDSEGDRPTVGQFQQQTMSPYIEQLKATASLFAAETGLTIDDLGFTGSNPTSAEAIKASHDGLKLTARKAQGSFGTGFLNAGFLAACVRDNFEYSRSQLYLTKPRWKPIFEADISSLSTAGDGLIKIQQAFPEFITPEMLEDMFGF